jgi:chromosome segregation ATPase
MKQGDYDGLKLNHSRSIMEKGSFQNLNLHPLEFADSTERFESHPSRKQQHQALEFIEIPKDLRKSGTVETLINQNEDLMARLTVTLRRMQALEDENRKLSQDTEELKRSYSSLSDQMLIWREKEKIWKSRNDQTEAELKVFQNRFPDYQKMENQIDRLKRYQERVKSTIKPYLQQLKDYAQSLHGQIQSLNGDLAHREAKILSLQHQIEALKEEKEQLTRYYEINQNDLVSNFETEKGNLKRELQALHEANQALEQKTQNLDRALERQDELENLIISLRRNKEEFQSTIQVELDALRNHNRELKQSKVELELSTNDLSAEKENLKNQIATHQARRDELEEQMTSLRYMWTSKSEENEKLKGSLSALEKLNLDLSAKMNEIRNKQSE